MFVALAGLVAAVCLVILVPQYLKSPLTQLQSSLFQSQEDHQTDPTNKLLTNNSPQNFSVDTPQSVPKPPTLPESASLSASDAPLYKVTRVVDGDTIVVNINGQDEKIRLIGVNTPESVDPRRPVECFGKEASNYTKSLLENQSVILESDPTQGDTDKYGRLLRYVLLPGPITTPTQFPSPTTQPAAPTSTSTTANQVSTVNINLKLIQDGYAHEYTYNKPYKYQKQFKQAQKEAEITQKGLWSDTTCQ